MEKTVFKHTNKQYSLGCISGFFQLVFACIFIYILFNLQDFLDTHAIEVLFLFLMAGTLIFTSFKKLFGGKEIKSPLTVTKSTLSFKETLIPFNDLVLDEYRSESYLGYHLYSKNHTFTIYGLGSDDLFDHLLTTAIEHHPYEIENYDFNSNSALIMIETKSGRMLGFNLDNGEYSIFNKGDSEEEKKIYTPDHFVQTPEYKRK